MPNGPIGLISASMGEKHNFQLLWHDLIIMDDIRHSKIIIIIMMLIYDVGIMYSKCIK